MRLVTAKSALATYALRPAEATSTVELVAAPWLGLICLWPLSYAPGILRRMPLTFEVDGDRGILRSHGTGVLSMADLLEYFAETRAHPAYDPSMHRVMDLREVTQLPSSDDIRSLATFARTKAPVETARMAIIASSDLAFGVSMMFKAFVGYGERLIVVRDEAEAMAWLMDGRVD